MVRRLEVPGTAGVIHRVNWDLRHEPPPFRPDTGRVEALPVLPHPVTPRGPFVSPGTYTVTLQAAGAHSSRTVEVRGDPRLALTQGDWREREAFLLELLDLQRRTWDADQRADSLSRRVAAERDSLAAQGAVPAELASRADSLAALARRLRALRYRAYRLAGAYNGRGVRQGSLYPPTRTHRQLMRDLEEELKRELAELERAASSEGP